MTPWRVAGLGRGVVFGSTGIGAVEMTSRPSDEDALAADTAGWIVRLAGATLAKPTGSPSPHGWTPGLPAS